MKNNILKLLALIMVLAMFVSAVPFASADVSTELPEINEDGSLTFPDGTIVDGEGGSEGDEGETTECTHAFTETEYLYGANGSHTKVVTCTAALCLKEVSRSSEPCTAGADGKCTFCGAEVPAQGGDEEEDDEDDDTCKHTDVDIKYTAKSGGKHTKTVTCKAEDCDYTSTTTEDCTANNEGKCIYCGAEVEDNNVSITCAQDGNKTSGDSITMRFVISGVDTDDISWTFSASGSADPDLSTTSGSGKSVSTTVYGEQGTARVSVKATWDGGSESATFSVSFYGGEDHIAVLEDNVSKFDFDDVGVFAKVDGTSSGASRKSMYTLLTDGVGTRVILSETRTGNSRVGKITYDGSSLFDQYDPDDNNDYSLTELEKLSFEVKGTGEYVLNYELFENSMLTSSGSVTIVTGEVAADIEYTVKAAGSTQFKVKDFENFWKKYGKSGEDLSYVTFEVSTTSDFNGALTYGKNTVKSTWKFFVDYDEDKANTYDLSKVVYQASAMEKNYTDQFNFTAYGKNGTKATGVVGVTVTNAKMSFSDVTSADWFYDEVYNVWVAGIMNGTDDKTFSPNATLTRGMVVTMLYRLEDSPATAARGTFSDVASGEWYAEAVEWAAKNDIVNGVGNDKFAPNDPITREQLATILYRYTTEYKNDTSATSGSLTSFGDADKVSAYAEDALRWAVGAKIITGDAGNLKPQGNATRAEAAAMFSRFMAL